MYILTAIKNTLYKLVNFLFGKTKIFVVILGWFLVISGLLMLLWPKRAQKKLAAIGFGPVKYILLVILLYLVPLIFSFGGKIGIWLALAAIAAALVFYRYLKKKAYNRIQTWFAKIPAKFLRIFAGIQIVIGVIMLIVEKRIW